MQPPSIGSEGHDASGNHYYTLQVDLPSEEVHEVVVSYAIPEGLAYRSDSLTISGARTAALLTIDGATDGSRASVITWSFGEVDNTRDQDLRVQFSAVVANFASNRDGVTIEPGRASLSWMDGAGEVHTISDRSRSVKVTEPDLQMDRQFEPSYGWRGDEVACILGLFHSPSSTADAFDVDVLEGLPPGLAYVPGSIEVLDGPPGTKEDGGGIRWRFSQVDMSWKSDRKIKLRYRATIDCQVRANDSLKGLATLAWTSAPGENPDERHYIRSYEGLLTLLPSQPNLKISLADNPDPLQPGGRLNYTIIYLNNGSHALDGVIEVDYDQNLAFVSASPIPDHGTNNHWSLGGLKKGGSGVIRVSMLSSSSIPNGSVLISSASISSSDGPIAKASASTKINTMSPLLYINNTASSQIIRPGGAINYTINYRNIGIVKTSNVTITDIIDPHLIFDPKCSNPRPSIVWSDDEGTHLYWDSDRLNSQSFAPGASGKIELQVSLPPVPEHPDPDLVYNYYMIDSNENDGDFNVLETFVVHSLYIRKKADKDVYSKGEVVNYTILYGNDLALDAEGAVIHDVLPDVEFLGADPPPSTFDGRTLTWQIGTIPAKTEGLIRLYARIKDYIRGIEFRDNQAISGYGFVRVDRKLSTALKSDDLVNYANITAYYYQGTRDFDSSSAAIRLADAIGTEVKIHEHGSGEYAREDETLLQTEKKIIQVETDLTARYGTSSFELPGNRSIDFASRWSEAYSSKNYRTGASINERYMYATSIDRESTLNLDENGSTLATETSFVGGGHIGVLKKASTKETVKETPIYESEEEYLGSFRIHADVDEYGKNVAAGRSISGTGLVAVDKHLGKSQRSYESGTGSYQVEDWIETQTSYMAKEINVSCEPVECALAPDVQANPELRWHEGMWSKSGTIPSKGSNGSNPASFIGEEFSQTDYLNKSTVARGLTEMETEAEFSGRAEFETSYVSGSPNQTRVETSLVDEYLGRYEIRRKTAIGGVARFGEPHISVGVVARIDPEQGSLVNYVITAVNDGNRALGPVHVLDLFPTETEYVYSSLRPDNLTESSASWTLVNLGIGANTSIDLLLNVTGETAGLVNCVEIRGGYDDQWARAQNCSVLQLDWLTCCPPGISATKAGYVDPNDSMLVHYRIALNNRENYIMAVSVEDRLPDGMAFINSTQIPADYRSDEVRWDIVDLLPGETRIIDYLARASYAGSFVNEAHIEAVSVESGDIATADVSCQVTIDDGYPQAASSEWQPPDCFGLSCARPDLDEGWISCNPCGNLEL